MGKVGIRRSAREYALKILYLIDTCKISYEDAVKIVNDNLDEKAKDFAEKLLLNTLRSKEKIDSFISSTTKNWILKRITTVDRNLIRLGISEILFIPDTPINVIINEAIEIAKKYSTEKSAAFVNGILDKLKNVRER